MKISYAFSASTKYGHLLLKKLLRALVVLEKSVLKFVKEQCSHHKHSEQRTLSEDTYAHLSFHSAVLCS